MNVAAESFAMSSQPLLTPLNPFESAYEIFTNSQPILKMLQAIAEAGRTQFHSEGSWEICLCALILTLEPNCPVRRILEALPYNTEAFHATDLLNTLAHMGYYCQRSESELADIDERLLPGLFIPQQGEPCIVLGRDGQGQLRFYDPLSKLVSYVPSSFEKGGKIWFFQAYDEHRAPTSRFMRTGSGYTWFRALLGRFHGTFIQVLSAGLVLNIIALSTPIFTILVYDRVIAVGSMETLPMLVVGGMVSILFEWKLRRIRSDGLSWLAGRLDNIVSNRIFAHLIGLSPTLIEKASIAAQIARIKTFESVRDFFSGSVFLSLIEAPFVVVAVIAMACISGSLVMVPLTAVLGYVALFMAIRQKVKVSIRIAAKASSVRQQFTIETFEKMEGIRTHGLAAKWQDKFRHLSGREMIAHFQLGWLGMVAENIANALTVCAAVSTIGFGAEHVWAGEMSAGSLVASMMLVWRILTPFYSLCTMVPRLEQLRNSIHQVNLLMDIETESEEAHAFSRLPKVKGAVSFHHVGFAYSEESDYIFQDLSFEAKVGDLVAITGANGTGKASVLKLIQSMHLPSAGTIRIDGFDIRQIDAPDLRRQIAYVPKVAHFFHGSVMENLRFANPTATETQMLGALEMADALADVQRLPQGLHTVIGMHHGVKLTSTLATKLSLARAYLHPAPLLLIDELPNALLSGKVGENLKRYLAHAKGKRTVICCLYRDDFMKMSDTIVWLRGAETPFSGARDVILPLLSTAALHHRPSGATT